MVIDRACGRLAPGEDEGTPFVQVEHPERAQGALALAAGGFQRERPQAFEGLSREGHEEDLVVFGLGKRAFGLFAPSPVGFMAFGRAQGLEQVALLARVIERGDGPVDDGVETPESLETRHRDGMGDFGRIPRDGS